MIEQNYCSEHNPAEALAGTADPVDVWILLEYKPVWKARALEESRLAEPVRAWLAQSQRDLAAAGLKSRIQFIRQPELDSDRVRLLLAVSGQLLEFAAAGYDALAALDLAEIAAQPPAAARLDAPHYFVCTNGQRDRCCARFGLPSYAALRDRVGARVWQATHLGGHRFAPNVLVLPQGALYGRVTAAAIDEFVTAVEAGELAFRYLRGRACHAPVVQAAEALSGRSDLQLLDMEEDGADTLVRFRSPEGPLSLRVRAAEQPVSVLKSCGDAAPALVYPYQRVE